MEPNQIPLRQRFIKTVELYGVEIPIPEQLREIGALTPQ